MKQLILLSLLVSSPVAAMEQVSPCIQYEQQKTHIHIAKIDLQCPQLEIIGTIPGNSDTTSNFAYQNKATIAINGTFYNEKRQPLGLNYTQQRTWANTRDVKQYSFLACTKDNQCLIEPYNKVTVYNPSWNVVVSGWQSMQNGKFMCAPGSPRICHSNGRNPHPRTAVGLSKDKRYLYMVVVEGRLDNFKGYTLTQLAKLFQGLGVPHAINLDGGGSSTMVIKNRRVNQLPSQQLIFERSVANHLGIIDRSS
ncbi:MAG: phosphodiester glycosidase family protein [Pelistega sp.]|nr:phosphodiester glycosidase family protein [Pelistega sp.]